ncbi:MAG TPA: hypothetical protein VLW85_02640 [Myxococcales bacterium]|nr:hypothetical protein [Myxococcales bacterium]
MPRKPDLLSAFVERIAEAVIRQLDAARPGTRRRTRRGKLSAAGRARIAAAQKKRWAEFRRRKKR